MNLSLSEVVERLRLTTRMSQTDWCDLLQLNWSEYLLFKAGQKELAEKSLEALAKNINLPLEALLKGDLDFTELALKSSPRKASLPERYAKSAFGRRRSSISSVQFIEDTIGWRLRHDVVNHLDVPEEELQNPFSPISVLFMTDLCAYLYRRGFKQPRFQAMGAYNYQTSASTILGQHYASLRSLSEVYESFFSETMKFFESNCSYSLTHLNDEGGSFEVRSNPDVAAELNLRHIGSVELCSFKAGHAASMPLYLGMPMAAVRETECVHRGDSVCRFEFAYN